MINQELSRIFTNVADYLEMNDEKNFFRIRAFRRAAESIDKYPEDVAKLNQFQLEKIDGIGKSIAADIVEYQKTGQIQFYETLKQNSPIKLEELNRIQGLGPKKIKKLYYTLGIKNVDELKKAAEAGLIENLEGFGKKSQDNILENLEFAIVNKERTRIDLALNIAQDYINYLKEIDKNIKKIKYGGSLRRKEETIGDIDLLVVSKNPEQTFDNFVNYKNVEKVLGKGDTKSSVWLKDKVQVDMRIIPNESFGSALQYFTGNVDHNVALRKIAIKKGLKLSEYGLFKKDGTNISAKKSEKWIYKHLVNQYIPPVLRNDNGEVAAALQNTLPSKLITLEDIKGDLQMHSTFSDGANTMEEMVEKCILKGYKYMGFTDHFGNLAVANAVTESEFEDYLQNIKRVAEIYKDKIKVFAGAEVNIKPNGSLDFDQKKLEKLDYVLASIHSSFKQTVTEATDRYLEVLQNPVVKIIGHPTGRLIGQRKGIEFNFEYVFEEAANKNVAIEINAHPMRLDVNFRLAKLACEKGCRIAINTDAHSIHDLDLMEYGVYVAQKAWIEEKNLYTPEFY